MFKQAQITSIPLNLVHSTSPQAFSHATSTAMWHGDQSTCQTKGLEGSRMVK
ncbi:hypothetical protein KFK09_011496 [Dendrobium nobile]|uniref:Uncharacterized protein n=1 Tax=Dendrobium nobile TaxID=94219 RepID=A0A8T3A622_DENNO|nr:hypothetical protein KFK09_029283 [Dendrobium nobile]KAI0510768.1 hypothetical protein KFK09_011377 [Dendrobium nobile]KAI0510885.1 hypothetical protein KFK09_011495 [Dendrobium nobile]KAI0510886.1 hypothetical protein KFK09_011496 [Dendrobium nobile]